MRRSRRPRGETNVSLFPFLAVLICTMGSLIVLLVMVVEQARAYATSADDAPAAETAEDPTSDAQRAAEEDAEQRRAADAAAQKLAADEARRAAEQRRMQREQAAQLREELEAQRDEFLWRAEILAGVREQKTKDLQRSRLELSHLESHITELETKLASYQKLMQEIQTQTAAAESATLRDQIAALGAQLGQLEERAAVKRQELSHREPEFAIIPYEGPNGTRRRPIYIECTAQGVVLQPEGVVLRPVDFEGPMGPGNPLDASVRAIREYWQRAGLLKDSEPYPLLLVRPDGVYAYAKARAALSNWDDEFGYELVGARLPLTFPFDRDPQLHQLLQATIATSRERQQMLARAMPRMFRGGVPGGEETFAASDSTPLREKLQQLNGAGSDAPYGGAGGSGAGGSGAGGSGAGGGTGGYDGAGSFGGGTGSFGGGAGRSSAGPTSSQGPYAQQLADQGIPPAGSGQAGNAGGQAGYGQAGGGQAGGGQAGGGQAGGQAGQAGGQQGYGQPGGQAGGQAGQAGGQQGYGQAGGQAGGQPGGGQAGQASGQQGSGQAGGQPGASRGQPGSSSPSMPERNESLAQSRGAGWALGGRRESAMAWKRPIRVLCLRDRLVIVSERGDEAPSQTVMTTGPVSRHADELVDRVRRHIARWGVAPSGGFWVPMLQVQVAGDGEHRFAELQTALQDSGYDVRRSQ